MTPGSDRAAPNAISSANEDVHRQEDIARCHRLAVAAFGAKANALEPLYRNGIVDYGPQFREIDISTGQPRPRPLISPQ